MSKDEIFFKLNETLLEIKKMINSGGVINPALLNYKINWAGKYLMMLMEE